MCSGRLIDSLIETCEREKLAYVLRYTYHSEPGRVYTEHVTEEEFDFVLSFLRPRVKFHSISKL